MPRDWCRPMANQQPGIRPLICPTLGPTRAHFESASASAAFLCVGEFMHPVEKHRDPIVYLYLPRPVFIMSRSNPLASSDLPEQHGNFASVYQPPRHREGGHSQVPPLLRQLLGHIDPGREGICPYPWGANLSSRRTRWFCYLSGWLERR